MKHKCGELIFLLVTMMKNIFNPFNGLPVPDFNNMNDETIL